MKPSHIRKVVEALSELLEDSGLPEDAINELVTESIMVVVKGIWDNRPEIRAKHRTMKSFLGVLNEVKQRSAIKTRYQREPVI